MAGTVEGDGSTTAVYQTEHPCPLPETMARPAFSRNFCRRERGRGRETWALI